MSKAATKSSLRSCAGFTTLLADIWYGRGAFARLAEMSRWRVVLVECAILALVCGGFYLLRYQAGAQNYRAGLKRTSEELQAAVLGLEAERRALRSAQGRLDVLSSLVLDRESRARLLPDLTAPSVHPGLEFLSVLPQPEQTIGGHVRCRALIALSGGFKDLLSFLRRIEAGGTPCAILQVEAESRPESGKPERFFLLIETYGVADPATGKAEPTQ